MIEPYDCSPPFDKLRQAPGLLDDAASTFMTIALNQPPRVVFGTANSVSGASARNTRHEILLAHVLFEGAVSDALCYNAQVVSRRRPSVQTIKKYANRKLYHTNRKQYITLDRIAELIRAGEQIQVVDNETGEDITASILAQVVAPTRGRGS